MFSTKLQQALQGFDEVIGPNASDFHSSGLKVPSVIRVARLAVVSVDMLIGTKRIWRLATSGYIGYRRRLRTGFRARVECLNDERFGSSEYVTVDELVKAVIEVAGKKIHKKYVEGPVGVQARNLSNARIHSLGWEAKVSLKACPDRFDFAEDKRGRRKGIPHTYPWIEAQVMAQRTGA